VAQYKVASKKIITVIENIGKAVLRRLGEEQIEKTLDAGSITSWIKVCLSEFMLHKATQLVHTLFSDADLELNKV
jgi:hypothetical protein